MMLSYPFIAEQTNENTHYRSLEATYATLMQMLRSPVVGRYELIQIKVNGENRPAVEVPYVIEFENAPLPFPVYHVGLIDVIFYDRVEKRYIVVDIKTHRDNQTDLSLRYKFDEQTIPYGLILEHILGHPIADFTVGYLSCYVDLLNPTVRFYDFIKSQEDIRDWYIGQCNDIKQIGSYERNRWFPRVTNGSTCMAFRRKCGFNEVCNFRDPAALARMFADNEPRDTLFHDGKEPWVSVKIPYEEVV
jgi:hypothetical protein